MWAFINIALGKFVRKRPWALFEDPRRGAMLLLFGLGMPRVGPCPGEKYTVSKNRPKSIETKN